MTSVIKEALLGNELNPFYLQQQNCPFCIECSMESTHCSLLEISLTLKSILGKLILINETSTCFKDTTTGSKNTLKLITTLPLKYIQCEKELLGMSYGFNNSQANEE